MGNLVRIVMVALLTLAMGSPAVAEDGRRVCLDPGHGGSDPGAVRGSLQEKQITLDVAIRLQALLTGHQVTLTRTDNETKLGNSERAAICNAADAEIVVSIHLNATTNDTTNYVWVFYGKRSKDLSLARTMDAGYQITYPDDSTRTLPHKAITNFANGTLLKSKAPAVLVETVFLSNAQEQRVLGDGTGIRQQQIAEQLHAGIVEWFRTH